MLTVTTPGSLVTTDELLSAFADFLNIDVSAGDAADDTILTYRRQIEQFVIWCEGHQLHPATITKEEIKRYRRWMIETKKFKPATIALKLSVVKRFYQAAVEKGLISTNPAVGVHPPREKRDTTERISYLDQTEVEQLFSIIPDDETVKSARDKALICIMALEGPRTVEMHRANFADVVRQGQNIGIRVEGKRSIRVVPLTHDLADILLKYLDLRTQSGEKLKPSSPLFISVGNRAKNKRLSRRGIRLIIDSYLNQSSLKYTPGRVISAHSLRHTAGTLALHSGAELRQVQDLLGHADPRTTTIYAHVAERWENNPALKVGIKFSTRTK